MQNNDTWLETIKHAANLASCSANISASLRNATRHAQIHSPHRNQNTLASAIPAPAMGRPYVAGGMLPPCRCVALCLLSWRAGCYAMLCAPIFKEAAVHWSPSFHFRLFPVVESFFWCGRSRLFVVAELVFGAAASTTLGHALYTVGLTAGVGLLRQGPSGRSCLPDSAMAMETLTLWVDVWLCFGLTRCGPGPSSAIIGHHFSDCPAVWLKRNYSVFKEGLLWKCSLSMVIVSLIRILEWPPQRDAWLWLQFFFQSLTSAYPYFRYFF